MKRKSVRTIVVTAILALSGALLVPASAQAQGQYPSGSTGIDISYPNCKSTQKLPVTGHPFVIAGVSGGRVYTDNPCAAKQAAYSPNSSLYVNTGLYTGGTYFQQAMAAGGCASTDLACGAYQYGYRAGQHAFNYAVSQGLGQTKTTWWLDVEETNTWDSNLYLNVRSIQGEYDAIYEQVAQYNSTIGIYAVPSQWRLIVGDKWPTDGLHNYPVWAADGFRSAEPAKAACRLPQYSVTGGPVYMVQWVNNYGTSKSLDYDYVCPDPTATP